MENWPERFGQLARQLQKDPEKILLSFKTFEPAPEKEIDEAEEILEHPLPKILKHFYQQSNGLELRWIMPDNSFFSKNERYFSPAVLGADYVWQVGSDRDENLIIIPSLSEVMNDVDENNESISAIYGDDCLDFDGKIYRNFGENIYGFDFWNSRQHSTILIDPQDKEDVPVLFSSKRRIELKTNPSQIIYLSDYFQHLLDSQARR